MDIKQIETPILAEILINFRKMQRKQFWFLTRIVWPIVISSALTFIISWLLGLSFVSNVALGMEMTGVGLAFIYGTYGFVKTYGYNQISIEVRHRLDNVPSGLVNRAYDFYKTDKYPWQCSAIECHESHLPGDCPLCGAE